MKGEQDVNKNATDNNLTKNSTNPLKAVIISKPTPKVETFSAHNTKKNQEKQHGK